MRDDAPHHLGQVQLASGAGTVARGGQSIGQCEVALGVGGRCRHVAPQGDDSASRLAPVHQGAAIAAQRGIVRRQDPDGRLACVAGLSGIASGTVDMDENCERSGMPPLPPQGRPGALIGRSEATPLQGELGQTRPEIRGFQAERKPTEQHALCALGPARRKLRCRQVQVRVGIMGILPSRLGERPTGPAPAAKARFGASGEAERTDEIRALPTHAAQHAQCHAGAVELVQQLRHGEVPPGSLRLSSQGSDEPTQGKTRLTTVGLNACRQDDGVFVDGALGPPPPLAQQGSEHVQRAATPPLVGQRLRPTETGFGEARLASHGRTIVRNGLVPQVRGASQLAQAVGSVRREGPVEGPVIGTPRFAAASLGGEGPPQADVEFRVFGCQGAHAEPGVDRALRGIRDQVGHGEMPMHVGACGIEA